MTKSQQDHDRMQRILEQTRMFFLEDAHQRVEQLQTSIANWQAGQLSGKDLAEAMYHTAHTLKGVAQTFGLGGLHLTSKALDDYIIQHGGEQTEERSPEILRECVQLAGALAAELERAKSL